MPSATCMISPPAAPSEISFLNRPFLFLLALLLAPAPALPDDDRSITLNLPPESLGQWYRPVAKRDVWLHTMFALRREMQAVAEYSALGDPVRLNQWLERLESDYRKIGEMVPEWQDELELGLFERMRKAGSPEELARLQRKLRKSCQGCHKEYKLVAALRYRTPDFTAVKVESSESLEEESYSEVMKRLTLLVNRVKIASQDGRRKAALDALDSLQVRLADLGESCQACHKEGHSRERILGKTAGGSLAHVRAGIESDDMRSTGRYLGEFAVGVCADCHAIHRLQSDLRNLLSKR